MISFIRKVYIPAFALLGLSIAALWYQASTLMIIETGEVFEEISPAREVENLVDIGVVDFDGDKYFDIFTTNHNQKQLLLKNDGTGNMVDVLPAVGLNQSRDFPGIELENQLPVSEDPGFYIFWSNKELILKWRPIQGVAAPAGNIILKSKARIANNSGFDIDINNGEKSNDPSAGAKIKFSAASKAEVRILPEYIALPVSIVMDNNFDLDQVYVGQYGVNPQAHEFQFELVDRHGMAWADYDSDNKLDVYITRGGLKGHMGRFAEKFSDELFKNSDSGFMDVIDESGIVKKTCPGYQVQWLDFNQDNALDIYISCQRKNENQLFMNDGSGNFTQVAKKQGVNTTKNRFHTPAVWIDINQDKKIDLLISDGDEYVLMINTGSGFKAEDKRFKLPDVQKMTINDYDKDNDLDIFAVSSSGHSALLKNTGSNFEQIAAADLGLPESGLTANWVDYDNDGLVDLHMMPGGIYRQNDEQGFDETGLLDHSLPGSMFQSIANWVDLDNDGDRDLVLAVYYKDSVWDELYERITGHFIPPWEREFQPWQIRTFINNAEKTGHHWLQLEVVGPPGNAQGIGARLTLQTSNNRQGSIVGQSEGSHLSQGHYRLYFGLGSDRPKSVEVNWPDGSHQIYEAPLSDSVIKIKQD